MTYWVIAKFTEAGVDNIYMAADVRVSRPASSNLLRIGQENPLREYADVSEKLFVKEYNDQFGNSIKIGICTSGFASFSEKLDPVGNCTISSIINSYLDFISKEKIYFANAEFLVDRLCGYIRTTDLVALFNLDAVKVRQLFKNNSALSNYILATTYFGVGLVVNSNASVASWNSKRTSSNADGYLESSFQPLCLNSLSPSAYRLQQNISTTREALNNLQSLEDFNGLAFVRSVIFIAARADVDRANAAQSISEQCDVAHISPGNPISPIIHPKDNATLSNYQQYSYPLIERPMPRDEMAERGGRIIRQRIEGDARARNQHGNSARPSPAITPIFERRIPRDTMSQRGGEMIMQRNMQDAQARNHHHENPGRPHSHPTPPFD